MFFWMDGSLTTNFDAVIDRTFGPAGPYAFLRQLGAALGKATRDEVKVLPNGHVRVVVDYPSLGDYTAAAMQLNALRAMTQEDVRRDEP